MKVFIASALVSILFLTAGCSAEQFGAGVNKEIQKVKIKDVIINPVLNNKTVNLEGIITTQCQSNGCWFFLNDGTGQILIDLSPKGFSIPPKIGKKALVTGIVVQENNMFKIIAYGVEII